MNRAVVTGIGLLTCAGAGKQPFWNAVIDGRSGISQISLFDTQKYRSHQGGEIKGLEMKCGSRARSLLSKAVDEAITESGLPDALEYLEAFVGTTHGSLDVWERYYRDGSSRLDTNMGFPLWKVSQGLFDNLADKTRVRTISTACTSSTVACGLALGSIRSGRTDVAIVAGVDILTEFLFAGFDSLRALSPSLCRPFDRNRDGLVLGEGAGVLILENHETALKRGANIYGEVAGFAMMSDAKHITAPDPSGKASAFSAVGALMDAGVDCSEVDYVNLHGTGTVHNDFMECMAMRTLFGDAVSSIPLSSIKPVVGHTSGAAGVIEAALCLLSIRNGIIPQTLNHREPNAEFSDLDFIADGARQRHVRNALSLNSAFGGNNAALLLRNMS